MGALAHLGNRPEIRFDLHNAFPDLFETVHRIDVVDALQTILIALVYAVDSQIAGSVGRRRCAAGTDPDHFGMRLGSHLTAVRVAAALRQVEPLAATQHPPSVAA